jgi:hypothetical protein
MTEKEIRELMEALERAYRILADAVARLDGESRDVARPDPRIIALEATEQRRQACPLLP